MKFNSSALKSSARAVLLLLATHRVARCIRKICGPPVGRSVCRSFEAKHDPALGAACRKSATDEWSGIANDRRPASDVSRKSGACSWRGVAWPGLARLHNRTPRPRPRPRL
uniref:Putative secreted protein n=1 Tax=Anopheles triannulatus TaxID=58253 RepID=A0A2M4B471_9DIPT